MSCTSPQQFERRFRIVQKLARVVANGTSGASGVLGDNLLLRVPTPKMQCQVSLACIPDNLGAALFNFKASAGNCLWFIQPLLDLRPEDAPYPTQASNGSPQLLSGQGSIIGGGPPNEAPLGVSGGDLVGAQSFVISDPNPTWNVYVSLLVSLMGGGPPAGYVGAFADYTPAPGYPPMSPEEWRYWCNQCALTPQVGNPSFLLQAT